MKKDCTHWSITPGGSSTICELKILAVACSKNGIIKARHGAQLASRMSAIPNGGRVIKLFTRRSGSRRKALTLTYIIGKCGSVVTCTVTIIFARMVLVLDMVKVVRPRDKGIGHQRGGREVAYNDTMRHSPVIKPRKIWILSRAL